MFGLTHLLAGLVIGKLTNNYALAVSVSLAIDADHIIVLFKEGAYKSWKRFSSFIFDETDPFGSPRTFFHTVYSGVFASAIAFAVSPHAGLVVGLSYAAHLAMDMLDNSDFRPFYPYGPSIRGPVKYFSRQELALDIALFAVFFII